MLEALPVKNKHSLVTAWDIFWETSIPLGRSSVLGEGNYSKVAGLVTKHLCDAINMIIPLICPSYNTLPVKGTGAIEIVMQK